MMSTRRCHCEATHPTGRATRRTWVLLLALTVLALPAAGAARVAGFAVQHAETVIEDNIYRLNATIDYRFSEEALEALSNGVPLGLRLDIEVLRKRDYLWPETVASLTQRYRLEYHALTELYIVRNVNSGEQESFRSLRAATASLGKIENLPMLDRALVTPEGSYTVRVRARLDVESLPAPLRPWAWFSSDWRLSSDWHTWSLTP